MKDNRACTDPKQASEIFVCGNYTIGKTSGKIRTRQTNDCRTRDYNHEKLKKVKREVREGAGQLL